MRSEIRRMAVLGAIAGACASEPSGFAAILGPDAPVDMAAVESVGVRVYLAEPRLGLFVVDLSGAETLPVSFDQFERIAPAIERPIAIALGHNALYVVERGGQRVWTVSPAGEVAIYFEGSPLKATASVAVAPDGEIAVWDEGAKRIFRISAATVTAEVPANSAALLQYQGSALTWIDSAGRKSLLDRATAAHSERTGRESPYLGAVSYRIHDGIEYVSDDDGVFAIGGLQTRARIPIARQARTESALLAVTERSLYVADRQQRLLFRTNRPSPVLVSFEGGPRATNAALVALYSDLQKQGRLEESRVHAAHDYDSLHEFVVDQGLLVEALPGVPPYEWTALTVPEMGVAAAARETGLRLVSLLCRSDPRLCPNGPTLSALSTPIPEGKEVILPRQFRLTRDVRVTPVNVSKFSATDLVNARVSPLDLDRIDNLMVGTLEIAGLPTMESEFTRLGLEAAGAPISIDAGNLITYSSGNAFPNGDISNRCGAPVSRTVRKTSLPPVIATSGWVYERIRQVVPVGTDVEVLFEGLDRADTDWTGVSDLQPVVDCVSELGARVAVSVLRTHGVRFRARRPGWRTRFEGLFGAAVSGGEYIDDAWQVLPDSGGVVGYSIASGSQLFDVRKGHLPKVSKAGRATYKWGFATGPARMLPLTVWKTLIGVSRTDVQSPSAVSKELAMWGAVLINDAPFSLGKGTSIEADDPQPDPGECAVGTVEVAKTNRRDVLRTIHYPHELANDLADPAVAILEDAAEFSHAGFAAPNERSGTAWRPYDIATRRFESAPRRISTGGSGAPVKFNLARDHGTHVGGLIGARRPPLMGLLPTAYLYFVPMQDSLTTLYEAIGKARVDGDVHVFNLSQEFKQAPLDLNDITELVTTRLPDTLFVVAAGNKGRDLSSAANLPAAWASSAPNVIGVGFMDETGERLSSRSNRGRGHVHLVAPGTCLFSLAAGNAYAAASGTSQAAPLVAAAATLLRQSTLVRHPDAIKARLMFTADWPTDLQAKDVSGGLLNVRRAVEHWDKSVTILSGAAGTFALDFEPSGKVSIKGTATTYVGDQIIPNEDAVSIGRVLRLSRNKQGRYRVFYLKPGMPEQLAIVQNAVLEGSLKCGKKASTWDPQTSAFVQGAAVCSDAVAVLAIQDYVAGAAAIPPRLRFR